ncbi:hypothetical protein J1605_002793 [Eschrichtius robustus]|uniref:Uncharacterized protein n=1 Tax=Eschrichtius robustus TaxID=9764 RepID=A0AB34HT76_ESCRO|nr:hypothetical protein J1605_002793 [Eschrichtius robustus]
MTAYKDSCPCTGCVSGLRPAQKPLEEPGFPAPERRAAGMRGEGFSSLVCTLFILLASLLAKRCTEVLGTGRPRSGLNDLNTCCIIPGVEGEHHEKAVELLKAAQGKVKLVVRYTPKVLEEMESRFEKMRSAKRRQQT